MRFVGIDIGAERHMVASIDEQSTVLQRPTAFREDAEGYQQLIGLLGPPAGTLIVMEATGHYWQNLFAMLAAEGFVIALINPLRTRRFAEEDLVRTKTDAIDALGLARFGQQKRPPATLLPESQRGICASSSVCGPASSRTLATARGSSIGWSI